MRKIVILAAVFLCVGVSLSAQIRFAAGIGGIFDASFNNGHKVVTDDNRSYFYGQRYYSPGAVVFFDAHYAEVNVGFAYGIINGIQSINTGAYKGRDSYSYYGGNMTHISFSLLGKFPINIGGLTFFPLVGLNYNLVLSGVINGSRLGEDNPYGVPGNLSQFGLLGGIGFDFSLSEKLFLRTNFLANLRFANKFMKNEINGTHDESLFESVDRNTTLGIGPEIKIAIGYRF